MIELTIFVVIAGVLLLSLLFLARGRHGSLETPALKSPLPVEDWFPRHAQYFALIRQAISESDIAYLSKKVRPESLRHARAERYHVVREYLAALREDFVHIERLSRTVAALSPKVNRRLEWERVWLGFQFRGLYGLAWLRLETGMDCAEPLIRLTNVVADLTSRVDALAAGLGQISQQAAGSGSTA